MRRVSVFGSTGSIGVSTLDVMAHRGGTERFDVVALTGGRNIELLVEQARRFRPDLVVTCHEELYAPLKDAVAGLDVEVAAGEEALIAAAERPADWIMSAIVGAAGLPPGLTALRHGSTLALANKESLVTAGPLLLGTAKSSGATVLPVDSEHSGIFQALLGEDITSVERIVLTASGGAFRDWPIEDLATATVAQASTHPNWNMGQRITIDSASMFNKAMEVIETKEFFGVSPDKIEVIIHPQSLVHALVGFSDGALMAHLGPHDMRHAIGFALNWPKRENLPVSRLDLAEIAQLTFREPDLRRYPALGLAREVMAQGGLSGTVFTAAKEAAMDAFIAEKIGFLDMFVVVSGVMDQISAEIRLNPDQITLDSIAEADHVSRQASAKIIAAQTGK